MGGSVATDILCRDVCDRLNKERGGGGSSDDDTFRSLKKVPAPTIRGREGRGESPQSNGLVEMSVKGGWGTGKIPSSEKT